MSFLFEEERNTTQTQPTNQAKRKRVTKKKYENADYLTMGAIEVPESVQLESRPFVIRCDPCRRFKQECGFEQPCQMCVARRIELDCLYTDEDLGGYSDYVIRPMKGPAMFVPNEKERIKTFLMKKYKTIEEFGAEPSKDKDDEDLPMHWREHARKVYLENMGEKHVEDEKKTLPSPELLDEVVGLYTRYAEMMESGEKNREIFNSMDGSALLAHGILLQENIRAVLRDVHDRIVSRTNKMLELRAEANLD